MKIYFDTEFIEDGVTIELISIGMIREDGETLYRENIDCDHDKADSWVQANVLPKLLCTREVTKTRDEIADDILTFAGERPEFWAYYAAHDWIALTQLYGKLMDLPVSWPMFCRDVKQGLSRLGNPPFMQLAESEAHNALMDAKWTRDLHLWLESRERMLDVKAAFTLLTDEERLSLFDDYCKACGAPDRRCFCTRDE